MAWAAVGATAVVGSMYMQDQAAGRAAGAAGAAAQAQAYQAMLTRRQIMASSAELGKTVTDSAAATPQELNILGQAYEASSQNIAQQQKLMAAIDPALMESSKQALTLLQGGKAQINEPMMNLRNSQRTQLLNQLISKYGPGAQTSAIGQRALQQFDMQTDSMFQQNQQQSLSQLMGISQSGNNNTNTLGGAIGGLQSVGSGYSGIQNRIVGANTNVMNSTLSALAGSSAQMIQTAGAPYVEAGLKAQGEAAMYGNIGNMAGTLGMLYGGGKGGAGGGSGGNSSVSGLNDAFSNSPNSSLQPTSGGYLK